MSVNIIFQQLCNYLQNEGRVEVVSALFAKQRSDSDRVEIATQLLNECNLLPHDLSRESKSLLRSTDLRTAGNKAFQKKNDKAALLLYTQSIAFAPLPSITSNSCNQQSDENEPCISDVLALAFANRSAALFSMGNYEACLNDINQAMKYNYPNKLLYKLFERQGKCFQALGRMKSAVESLDNAVKWLPSASALTAQRKESTAAELRNILQQLVNSKDSAVSDPQTCRLQSLIPTCSYNKNNEIPCASDCMELKYTAEMERHIAARRDISAGDVLAVEKPFASVLLPECFMTHCYNCLERSYSLLPCSLCSTVMYCSEECLAASWNKIHVIDCPLLAILQELEIGKMGFLALRIVIMICNGQNLDNVITSLEDKGECDERTKGFNDKGTYSSSEYGPIYWLVGNTKKRAVADLFKRAVTAACILYCLETMTNFFSKITISDDVNSLSSDASQYKSLVGGLLLRHLQNLPCNAHEISELIRTKVKTIEEGVLVWESVEIGAGAYAMLSLLNHSCDPNVVRHSYQGDMAILRAIRPIKKGEQVLDNYGYHYALHDRAQRRTTLETQYHFTCGCIACTEDWSTYEFLPGTNPTYLCTRCSHVVATSDMERSETKEASCKICNQPYNITDIKNKIEKSSKAFRQNLGLILSGEDLQWDELSQKLVGHLHLLDSSVQRPWKEYNDCQEAIKQCFAMTANCNKEQFHYL